MPRLFSCSSYGGGLSNCLTRSRIYFSWTPEFIPKWLEKYEFVWYMKLLSWQKSFSDPKKLTIVFFKWSENIQFSGEKILWSKSEKCTNFQRHVSFLFTWLAMWAIFLIKKHFDDYGWKKNLMFIWLAMWANLFKFKNISTIIAEKHNVIQLSYSNSYWWKI